MDNIAWNPAMISHEILIVDNEKQIILHETRLWSAMKYWLWTMKSRQHCMKPSYDQLWNTGCGPWKADNIAWNPAMINDEILIVDRENRTTLHETQLLSAMKYWLWTVKSRQHCLKPSYDQLWNTDCGPQGRLVFLCWILQSQIKKSSLIELILKFKEFLSI